MFKVLDNQGKEVDYSTFVQNLEPPVQLTLDAIDPGTEQDQANLFRMLHGAIGLTTETGELMDMFKKVLFAGKSIDIVNLKEELGDVMWYFQLICNAAGFTIDDTIQANARKLNLRHGSKFNQIAASNYDSRDLTAERQVLEASNTMLSSEEQDQLLKHQAQSRNAPTPTRQDIISAE